MSDAPAVLPKDLAANPILSRWIRVRPDGLIDVRVGKVELGQGILTALAQLAADELGVDLAAVRMLPADTAAGPDEGVTAGSLSVSTSGPALRAAAAHVRTLFAAAAARIWELAPEKVSVAAGRFTGPDGRSTGYAELAAEVDLDVPAQAGLPLSPGGPYTGADTPRLDLPDKIAGRPRYVQDIRLPGQWFARVIRPPSPGATLISVSAPDGVTLLRDGSFVAIAGPDEAGVVRAAEQVSTEWSEVDSLPDEDDLGAFLRAGPHETIPVADDAADAGSGTAGPVDGQRVRATYSRPFLAHASMAPSCAVALCRPDGQIQVWSHSQGIGNLARAIAAALDLDPATVHVRHAENAGCYGHNGADDAAFDAVLVARALPGIPVQVLWSRPDELAWAPFSSAMTADVEAVVDVAGRIGSWTYDLYSQGHNARPGYAGVPGLLAATTLAEPAVHPAPTDPPPANGGGSTRNALPGYDLPGRKVTGHRLAETPLRSSALRSLGAFFNVFAIESFLDEAAEVAGADPLEFRLAHLSDPRGRRVLELAAAAAGWGRAVPDGTGLGLGYARYKGTGAWCAVVAEVEAETEIRVRRLWTAVDVGRVVNPDGVRNQIEGGAVQAASWTLLERVRFDRRRVTSTTWESYPILPFSRVPEVSVEIAPADGNPSVGAGEAAQGPTAGAIANALTAAVGVRVRDLPLTPEALVQAIERTP